MIDRQLRARVLLDEARALGIEVADLVAADTNTAARLPTVGEFIEMIAPTFTPSTAATYQPYWRLAVARLGDRHSSTSRSRTSPRSSLMPPPARSNVAPTAPAEHHRRAASPRYGHCSAAPSTPVSSPSTRPPRSPNPAGLAVAAEPWMTTSWPS